MRQLNAGLIMALMASAALAQPRTEVPLRLKGAPSPPPQPPKSKRQAELTARADRRRARRNGDA